MVLQSAGKRKGPALFTAANRMVGRTNASQIASASDALFLLVFTNGFTYCGGISRTSWPSACFPCPVMSARAGFHADQAWCQIRKERN